MPTDKDQESLLLRLPNPVVTAGIHPAGDLTSRNRLPGVTVMAIRSLFSTMIGRAPALFALFFVCLFTITQKVLLLAFFPLSHV
jgi:hypothetical protein